MFRTLRGHTIYTPPLVSGPVVLDLGANRGAFSRDLNAWYGGSYHLVEANPAFAATLAVEDRFPVRNCAVAGEDGPIVLNIANNLEGSSILTLPETSVYACTLRETVEIQGRRLDGLIAEFGLDRIDLLKMDIEGAEGVALASLSDQALKSIGQLTVEFHCDPLFGFDVAREVDATIARMRDLGFMVFDFSYGKVLIDVLMINREFHGIGVVRAAVLNTVYVPRKLAGSMWWRLPPALKTVFIPRKWPRSIWGRLPESVRNVVRRLFERSRPSTR